jgi:hypothetical protein
MCFAALSSLGGAWAREAPRLRSKHNSCRGKHDPNTQHLEAEAEGLLGCVMVFSLVTAAKDWLEANNLSAAQDWGVAAQEEAEAAAAEEAAGIRKNRTGRVR